MPLYLTQESPLTGSPRGDLSRVWGAKLFKPYTKLAMMKKVALLALVACTLAAMRIKADDNQENHSGSCTADFDQSLKLTATSNAPAGARGVAKFIAVDDNGTNYEALFVKTKGLSNDTYTVTVTDDNGTNYVLGTLNVTNVPNMDGEGDWQNHQGSDGEQRRWRWGNDGETSAGWTNWVGSCAGSNSDWTNMLDLGNCTNLYTFATNAYCWYTNTLTVGSGSFILPDGLSQTIAAEISISDSSGNVDLYGNFNSTSNSTVNFEEEVSVVPGTDSNAQGTATLTIRQVKSRKIGKFSLKVAGLPARQKLFLSANGTHTMRVVSNGKGKLNVRVFPRVKAANLQNIVAKDKQGNVVFTVNF